MNTLHYIEMDQRRDSAIAELFQVFCIGMYRFVAGIINSVAGGGGVVTLSVLLVQDW